MEKIKENFQESSNFKIKNLEEVFVPEKITENVEKNTTESHKNNKELKTIFLTGATGFVGSHLATEFLKEGHSLIILARGDEQGSAEERVFETLRPLLNVDDYDKYFKDKVKVLEGNIDDSNIGLSDGLIMNIPNIDEVVHSAASLSFREKDRDKTMNTNVGGTVNLLDFAKKKEVKRINFVSTAYVCGQKNGIVKEEIIPLLEKPKFNNPYEESKYIAEQKIKDWSFKEKVPVNIFRPSIIVSKDDTDSGFGYYAFAKTLSLMRRNITLNEGTLKLPGNNDAELNLIEINDVVRSVGEIIKTDNSNNETKVFHLTNPQSPKLRNIFNESLDVLGIGGKIELVNDKKHTDSKFYDNMPKQKTAKEIAKTLHDLLPYLFSEAKFEVKNTNEVLDDKYCPEEVSKNFIEKILKHRYTPDSESNTIRDWEKNRPVEVVPKEYRHKEIETGKFEQKTINIALGIFKRAVGLFLKPSGIENTGELYSVEAKNYDLKHHLTTAYFDTKLRKRASDDVLNHVKNSSQSSFKILDIATGTGLTLEEINKKLAKFNEQKEVEFFGIDFTEAMLKSGRKRMVKESSHLEQSLKKGDATSLVGEKEGYNGGGFYQFKMNSIDCITDIFGIGGIANPVKSFEDQLKVLKEGGISIMMDMHAPSLEENDILMPFGLPKSSAFVQQAWESVTKPIVLKKLWGWNDPTENFYTMPLASYFDEQKNKYFGFKLVKKNVENLKWWLGLPLMPVCEILA